MSVGEPTPAVAWLAPDQGDLVQAIAARLNLRITAVGCAEPGRRADLADRFNAQPLSDPRAALAATTAPLFLFADPGDFGARAAHDDARVIRAAGERGVRVATLEPMPASVLELVAGLEPGQAPLDAGPRAQWAHPVPLSRWTSQIREIIEILDAFGTVRAAAIHALGAPAHGSLGARLFDAMDLVLAILGQPETIDASFVAAAAGQPLHAAPGDTLRGLHGDLAAHLRFADGKSATLLASNQAAQWERVVTLLGPGGRLRVYADGFEWVNPQGEKIDASRQRRIIRGASATVPPAVLAISDQLETLLQAGSAAPGVPDYARVLALAQAALLSARTGEGESPGTILRMAGA
jgi:hypothetical protein